MKNCNHSWLNISDDLAICVYCCCESHKVWFKDFYYKIILLDFTDPRYSRIREKIKNLKKQRYDSSGQNFKKSCEQVKRRE